jgi:CRP-like cAMP-binding protein
VKSHGPFAIWSFQALRARQILSLHLPGDLLDLQTLYLNIVDHSIQAASEIRVLEIDRDKLKQVAMEHPAFGRALVEAALIEASVQREWVLNVGRRDARTRVAHLICELEIRMRVAGVIESAGFQLPMTQEQLGDATGLTAVHLNRTLKGLVKDGLIDQQGRQIEILDRQGLKRAGDFSSLYLHLDQIAPGFAGA